MIKDKVKKKNKKEGAKQEDSEPPLKDMKIFTPHDLRRSAATAWGMYLKTQPHVIELMLNHKPLDKLIETYQQAPYSDEQRDSWFRWGVLVEQKVAYENNNIIPLMQAIKI